MVANNGSNASTAVEKQIENTDVKTAENIKINRILSIDRLRGGLCLGLLITAFSMNFNMGFLSTTGSHMLADGFLIIPQVTIADVGIAAFFFLVGFSYHMSFKKRLGRDGKRITYLHFIKRGVVLIGTGAILVTITNEISIIRSGFNFKSIHPVSAVFLSLTAVAIVVLLLYLLCYIPKLEKYKKYVSKVLFFVISALAIVNICFSIYKATIYELLSFSTITVSPQFGMHLMYWGPLQSIGLICLLIIPLMKKVWWKRLIWSVVLFVAYSVYHTYNPVIANVDFYNNIHIMHVQTGGSTVLAAFAWAPLVIVASIIGEVYVKNIKKQFLYDRYKYLICILVFVLVLALITYFTTTLDFRTASPGSIIFGLAWALVLFTIFECFNFLKLPHFDFLKLWGQNATVSFVFFVLLNTAIIALPYNMRNLPMWGSYLLMFAVIVACTFLLWILDRKKIMLRA